MVHLIAQVRLLIFITETFAYPKNKEKSGKVMFVPSIELKIKRNYLE